MKIIAPISSVKEVEMLLHHGADEFYCGVQTPEWETHFGNHLWMNRRSPSGANLGSWEEIREVAERAHDARILVNVTLNAPFYTQAGMDYLLRLAEKLVGKLDIDSFIVSDINFLKLLSEENLPVNLHLSSLSTCINSYAVDFYRSLGIKRIILPRQLTLSEIEKIVTANDHTMAFEVFAVNDGCFFEEGLCQTTHAFGNPFCLTEWDIEGNGEGISDKEIKQRAEELGEYLWYQNNCGSSSQKDGLPNGPCSLCWFGYFQNWGVNAVKIVGREASFYRKMRSLQLVKGVMDEVNGGASPEEVVRFARTLRNTPAYCDKGYMCYFRDSESSPRGSVVA